jgi:hypothetical protein
VGLPHVNLIQNQRLSREKDFSRSTAEIQQAAALQLLF